MLEVPKLQLVSEKNICVLKWLRIVLGFFYWHIQCHLDSETKEGQSETETKKLNHKIYFLVQIKIILLYYMIILTVCYFIHVTVNDLLV